MRRRGTYWCRKKQRRYVAVLWFSQVDAAADDEAEMKLDDGSGARVQRRREEEEEAKETKGKMRRTRGPIYKAKR